MNLPINKLPQETLNNNSLLFLGISFMMVVTPHIVHLPLWISSLCLFSVFWKLFSTYKKKLSAPRWLLVSFVVVGGIAVMAEYHTITGRDAGVSLLIVMTSLKFLEAKTLRDAMLLVFLSYFLIVTNFLFSQSIPTALYMLFIVTIITTSLITLNIKTDNIPIKERFRYAGLILIQSIPLMIVLFVLFPRIPGPLWGMPNEQNLGVTGLSDDMSPGQISNLIQSNAVAFRVKFTDKPPAHADLYWRGPVLWNFDGNTWRQRKTAVINPADFQATGDPINYTVTLEPNNKHWLFALDIATSLPTGSRLSHDYQIIQNKKVTELKRYDTSSSLQYLSGLNENKSTLKKALHIPKDSNPKTQALGKQWRETIQEPSLIVAKALAMYRNDPYVYTLTPPLLGKNSMDDFLFQTRRGFCEHYAGSFVLLMRAAGIPARVVTGYQGGEINPLGEYMIVRQSDAHAWSEVWLSDQGWVRVDPTAAVAPERVELGLEDAIADTASLPFLLRGDNAFLNKLSLSWDSINNNWNEWVLGYGPEKQRRFLSQLGIGINSVADMVIALVFCLALVASFIVFIHWYNNRPRKKEVVQHYYEILCKKLAKKGLLRHHSESSTDFSLRAEKAFPEQAKSIRVLIHLYQQLRYAGQNNKALLLQFKTEVRQIKLSL